MKQLTRLVVIVTLAACGSKSPAPASRPEPAHDHAAAGSGSAVATPEPTPKERVPDVPAKPDPKVELLAAEMAAWETAKPVVDRVCATCHTTAGKKAAKKKLDHVNFDTYPPGGHHTATIGLTIREVLGLSGKKATMPYDKPGSVKGDDLAKLKSWTDAWEAADKAGAHPAVTGQPGDDDDKD